MRILLDTCAYSAFMRGQPQAKTMIEEAEEVFLNPIVLGELKNGFLKGKKINENKIALKNFMDLPGVSTVNIDPETSELYALILDTLRKTGTTIPTNDVWIAASAMQHGLRIATSDTHFKNVPQVIVEYIQL